MSNFIIILFYNIVILREKSNTYRDAFLLCEIILDIFSGLFILLENLKISGL